ncbi:hypothetical protein [Poinsettia branch-inducing phytoplasma]|nr:hypothetical protein [Poinsettia branch-inducing phytoplasma]
MPNQIKKLEKQIKHFKKFHNIFHRLILNIMIEMSKHYKKWKIWL